MLVRRKTTSLFACHHITDHYLAINDIFSSGNEFNDPRRIYTDLAERNINGWIDIDQLTSSVAGSIGMVGVSAITIQGSNHF